MRNGLFALLAANKGRGQFHAQATGDNEATIWLYDAIVSDDYWGGVSALTIGKSLAEYRDKSIIHLRINSPGGDVFAGRAMQQLIAESPSKIITHVDGYAASAASYVALAGHEVHIAEGGMFMIHKGWTLGIGNADDLRKVASLLDQIDESLVATYASKTGQDPDQIRQWLTAETWFTAEESVQYGFATQIASTADSTKQNASSWDLSAYARAPRNAPPPAPRTDPPENTFDRAAALRHLEAATL
jgi:ATP-dependent Clp protease, protease subunit